MENESIKRRGAVFIKKYKYAVLVLLIGFALMLLPVTEKDDAQIAAEPAKQMQEATIEEQLENILSQIDGAGNVKVLLTEAKGERIVYQMDSDTSSSDSAVNESLNTVTVTDAQKNQTGLIVQIEPPVYLGAVIVSEGANKPAVKLALVEAVAKVTGLGANQITVLKMK